jgi:hypothetical protein
VEFSDYIVYVDESGDHSLSSINEQYPAFVLAFCIFRIDDYVGRVVPAMQRLKFDVFGHDTVVLHERDIRKAVRPFDILQNASVRGAFLGRLTRVISDSPFSVVACVIDKREFARSHADRGDPYHVALGRCMEAVFDQLSDRGQSLSTTTVVFESRGRAEDHALRTEFTRIQATTVVPGLETGLQFRCASKSANSTGLQVADMVARPIGLHVLRPHQENRAWEIIATKIRDGGVGASLDDGLVLFPAPPVPVEREAPGLPGASRRSGIPDPS